MIESMMHNGLVRSHWIQNKVFLFYVGASAGLRSEISPDHMIDAGFVSEADACVFAQDHIARLSGNFVFVYDDVGNVIKTFTPN